VRQLAPPALVAAACLVLAAPASGAAAKSKTARSGATEATVTWRPAGHFAANDVRLVIERSGETALQARLGRDVPQAIRVRDLDPNGEPEVVVDLYTGGAHCCFYSRIYRYTGAGYAALRHVWGNLGYQLRDLDHDGAPELLSSDDRFAYVFTAYAGSAFPIQVWDYRAGRLIDVSRRHPALVRRDAGLHWKDYLRQRTSSYRDPRGILAAWMADQYLLGRQAHGWAVLTKLNRRRELRGIGDGHVWATGKAYLAKLRTFLERHGYG
jgi:hypothetical protein